MSGWIELEYETQEEADEQLKAYSDLYLMIEAYVEEAGKDAKCIKENKRSAFYWETLDRAVLALAFQVAGHDYDEICKKVAGNA